MSYVVMARKWRPQSFEDMVGQEHIVRTLKNAIQANRISHAYLFTGPRGVGKTTTARLLAKAVNCLSPVDGEPCNHCVRCEEIVSGGTTDVIEIDAASNGLVDDARELREKVRYAPLSCRYKVMIIDEVHMMSNAAFNALLKTLEEPPAHSIFILATTESHKVPATIVSRCQRFDFRRIPVKQITERLALMASSENINVDEDALHIIARGADGGLRDAQSLLDQIISFSGNNITADDVVTVLGLVNTQVFIDLVDAIATTNPGQALTLIEQLVNQGTDLRLFMKDWVDYWRALVVTKVVGEKADQMLNQAANAMDAVKRQVEQFSLEELIGLAKLAAATDDELRRTQHPRILLEIFLMQVSSADRIVSLEAIWQQLQGLEKQVAGLPDHPLPVAAAAPAMQPAAQPSSPAPERKPAENEPVPVTETTAPEPVEQPGDDQADDPGAPVLVVDTLEDAEPETYKDFVKQQWMDILEMVGEKNRRAQALLRDVELTDAEDGWVELTCASEYHMTGLDKDESRKDIEAILEEKLERSTRMRLKVKDEGTGEPMTGEGQQIQKEKEYEEIARKEPLVQKTLDIFGGKIVDVIHHSGGTK